MVHREAGLSLRIARVLAPVTVLGPGRRIVVWVQGCAIACAGCASVDTWDPSGGQAIQVDELAALLVDQIRELRLDGLTITGGEPTSQPAALGELVRQVREGSAPLDVLVFTGRTDLAARRVAPDLIGQADCVVAGPYRQDLPGRGRLVASDNQVVSFGSPAARQRYATWLEDESPRRLELTADSDSLYLVGLPDSGDLVEFERRLHDRGITLREATWTP